MKKPYKILYHVFSDNFDEWTETYKEAWKIIKDLKANGYTNLRIYEEIYETEEDYKEGYYEESCLYSKGEWPM